MAGKVRVEGDMAKLMALQAAPAAADTAAADMAARFATSPTDPPLRRHIRRTD